MDTQQPGVHYKEFLLEEVSRKHNVVPGHTLIPWAQGMASCGINSVLHFISHTSPLFNILEVTMWHLNSGGGAFSSSFPSEEKHFHLWDISDNTDNKVRKIEMTIKFRLIPNVIKRLVCLWSRQLFFWKHLSFLSYLLTERWKKLDIYFDKTTCLWGVRCPLQEDCCGRRRNIILPLTPNKHHHSLQLLV